jgi:hypothetical protein
MSQTYEVKASKHHTHRDLYVPALRSTLARDLWVLRKVRQTGASMKSEWVAGVRLGLETMARRIQDDEVNYPNIAGRDQFVMRTITRRLRHAPQD